MFRERVEVIGGRVFPATCRFDFDGEPVEVDAAKSLWSLGHGLIPTRRERTIAALVLLCPGAAAHTAARRGHRAG
ncbi:hypothetical protein ACIBSV_50325 [Embleya sp. NPDC050154]|uniref:hypothetical protein n=1 Tax=Embleya sp. NPDC050154 TaxID=3363988 RepID=UPI0037BD0AC4